MEPERHDYKGHRIELRESEAESEAEPELLIDDETVRYGQLPNGMYALHEYAYDWQDNLIDLAQGLIDYRERADETRREAESSEEN